MSMLATIQHIIKPLFPGLMGMQLTEVGPERVVASLEVRGDLCTTGETLHGGAIMAFADTLGAIGTFVNLPPDARTATIESKTNFIGAARLDLPSSANARPFIAARPPWCGRQSSSLRAAS